MTAFVRRLSVSIVSPISIMTESFCNKVPSLPYVGIEDDFNKIDDEKCAVLVCLTRKSKVVVPQVLIAQDSTKFFLVLVETASLDVLLRVVFRHDPFSSHWFKTCLINEQCNPVSGDIFGTKTVRPRLMVYVKSCEPPLYAMSFAGGQNEVKCLRQDKFLCVEVPGNSPKWAAESGKCQRVVAWSCPHPGCQYGLCKRHLEASHTEVFAGKTETVVKGPTVAVDDKLRLDCDAGDFARYVINQRSVENASKPLPLHLLLNVF